MSRDGPCVAKRPHGLCIGLHGIQTALTQAVAVILNVVSQFPQNATAGSDSHEDVASKRLDRSGDAAR